MGRLSPDSVRAAARRWGEDDVQLINAGYNHVYRAGEVYLRFTHEALRDADYLAPPLDFLRHLHAVGAPVCEPLPSQRGRWTERVEQAGDTFLVTAVRRVPGERLSTLPATPGLYRAFGRSVGELHTAASLYRPPILPHMIEPGLGGVFPTWRLFWNRAEQQAKRDDVIGNAFARLTPWVNAVGGLPQGWPDGETYERSGLTHGDLRPGNAIWDGRRVVIIDFDEPVHGPWALDLARGVLELSPVLRAALQPHFLDGYREVRLADPGQLADFPRFLAARAALMAAWSLEDASEGPFLSGSGTGAVVSLGRLRKRLAAGEFGS